MLLLRNCLSDYTAKRTRSDVDDWTKTNCRPRSVAGAKTNSTIIVFPANKLTSISQQRYV